MPAPYFDLVREMRRLRSPSGKRSCRTSLNPSQNALGTLWNGAVSVLPMSHYPPIVFAFVLAPFLNSTDSVITEPVEHQRNASDRSIWVLTVVEAKRMLLP